MGDQYGVVGNCTGFNGRWDPTERIGRTPTLIAIGILYFTSAIWSAVATDIYSFMVASDRSTGVTGNRNVE